MAANVKLRTAYWNRRGLAYVLAVVLPIVSSLVTVHIHWLRAFPLALHFLSLFVVAALGGFWPALIACFTTLVSRGYFEHIGYEPGALSFADKFRAGFLLLCTLIIASVFERRMGSERKSVDAHRELEERTANLIQTLNSTKCACWTIDLDSGQSARWYRGSYEVFGRSFDEIEALPSLRTLLHPDDQPRLTQLAHEMRSTPGPIVFDFRTVWPDGETHWLEMRGTRINQDPCCWRGVTIDITDRRVAETALIRAEKLAAMGRLASTIAHEINNPLEAVTNLLYLSLLDDALSPATRTYLVTADAELARLGNIARLTLGFVRETGERASVDLASVVDDVVSIFSHRSEFKMAEIERLYTPGIHIAIAKHELRQIVTNLVANAADALSGVPAPRLRFQVDARAGNAVLLVADNGAGIRPDDAHRIFEPFYTTKGDVGTGIGLWVTRELVEKNGGSIHIDSGQLPDGLSTCFRLEFPLA